MDGLPSARRGRGRRSAASLPTANCTISQRWSSGASHFARVL